MPRIDNTVYIMLVNRFTIGRTWCEEVNNAKLQVE